MSLVVAADDMQECPEEAKNGGDRPTQAGRHGAPD